MYKYAKVKDDCDEVVLLRLFFYRKHKATFSECNACEIDQMAKYSKNPS